MHNHAFVFRAFKIGTKCNRIEGSPRAVNMTPYRVHSPPLTLGQCIDFQRLTLGNYLAVPPQRTSLAITRTTNNFDINQCTSRPTQVVCGQVLMRPAIHAERMQAAGFLT